MAALLPLRPDESSLLRRARQGDLEAFEGLYRAHAPRIHGLCARMAGDARRAEDLTQETFLRAWRGLPRFEGRAAFGTWLHRLAVNVVLDDRRAQKRAPLTEAIEHDPALHGRVDGRPEAALSLDRAIRTLPEGARHVFVLHDVEGYPHAEIALAMGVTEGTTRSQLHRARALLREALR